MCAFAATGTFPQRNIYTTLWTRKGKTRKRFSFVQWFPVPCCRYVAATMQRVRVHNDAAIFARTSVQCWLLRWRREKCFLAKFGRFEYARKTASRVGEFGANTKQQAPLMWAVHREFLIVAFFFNNVTHRHPRCGGHVGNKKADFSLQESCGHGTRCTVLATRCLQRGKRNHAKL